MTKLEALNVILDGIGVRPVTTYGSSHPDASVAREHLTRATSDIQDKGWWFNTEHDITLSREALTNKIPLPSNALDINPTDTDTNYVQRNTFLYDMEQHTYVFTEDVVADIIFLLPFEELPSVIQKFITRTATYEFSITREGDQNKLLHQGDLLLKAKSAAYGAEIRNGNYNALKTKHARRVMAGIKPMRRR